MAKKKKSTKRRRSGGRRVSGIASGLTPIITAVAGAAGANFGVQKLKENAPNITPNMINAGQIILGILLAKTKNPMVQSLGVGIACNGGIDVAKSFGLLSGVGNSSNLVTFSARPQLNGMDNVISGEQYNAMDEDDTMGDLAILAGTM